jgi:alkylation response protein AidB-like acyl-CoA dehydrogenase
MEEVNDELSAFVDAVSGVLDKVWGEPTAAGCADVGSLWAVAAEQGWFELASAEALDLAIAAARRTGRSACPLPIVDGYVAADLFPDAGIDTGTCRVIVAPKEAEFVDDGGVATHVATIPPAGGTATLTEIAETAPAPGLAIPAWSRITLGDIVAESEIDRAKADRALSITRLGRAARALGAAEHAHQMAIEHTKTRKQFGKAIGSFGAVQQRTAQCQIELRAADLLLGDAVSALVSGAERAVLAAEFATAYIADITPRVQLGAHHTLAAIGYFEEHPAPWLFRRVHSDTTMLQTIELAQGTVADAIIETGARLPAAELGERGEAFRSELLEFVAGQDPADRSTSAMVVDEKMIASMAEKGWLGFSWPTEYGGRNATLAEQVVLNEETTYRRLGVSKALGAVTLLGAPILRHGTEDQKNAFLPLIRSGQMNFCLGYSEPEAGSDLASLRTSAVLVGNEWVINGQKLWTTGGHEADWVWLAARTDPDASPRHAGITVFLFPMDTPGITVQQHTALSGEISCTVFYDDVRIPDSARVGEANGGWAVIVDALAGERISMGNIAAALHRQFDDLLDFVSDDQQRWVGPRGSAKRAVIGDLATRVQATRALVGAAVQSSTTDIGAMFDAAMAGVMGGDLAEDFGEATLKIFGPAAALSVGYSGEPVPGNGAFEYGLRQSIMYVVGGGTNDVQRGLIARGLGLPR